MAVFWLVVVWPWPLFWCFFAAAEPFVQAGRIGKGIGNIFVWVNGGCLGFAGFLGGFFGYWPLGVGHRVRQ